ncbi:MAG: hypothetical protein M9930_18080, partial [Anaerolineae bacterium]|nr:hypothetical protein [Anaerolineae bacterium]
INRFRLDEPQRISDRHLIRWSQMMKRFYTVYATLILFAVPTLAFAAEADELYTPVNPPGWVAWFLLIVALLLPFVFMGVLRRSSLGK